MEESKGDRIAHIDFDPNPSELYLEKLKAHSQNFLKELSASETKSYRSGEKIEADKVDAWLDPDQKQSFEELLDFLPSVLNKSGIQPAFAGHLGYIPGGGLFENAVAAYLSSLSNYYSAVSFASPYAVKLENSLLAWMAKIIGYGEEAMGNITSGGSIANLSAIHAAKNAKGVAVEDIRNQVVYLSSQMHHSLKKALKITNLNQAVLREIRVDKNLEMEMNHFAEQVSQDLEQGLEPFLVISNGGSTNSGAVDDLSAIAKITRKYKIWHHVDAAYGGAFLLTEKGRKFLQGIEAADSVTIDPHKGFFQSYGIGMILVKNGQHLFDAFSEDAEYMRDAKLSDGNISPANLSIELSRPFRGLSFWFSLKIHGKEKYAQALNEKLLLTQYLYHQLKKEGFEMGPKPKLSVLIFKLSNDQLNRDLLHDIHKDGKIFISSTGIQGKIWLRAAILSHRTSFKEVEQLIQFVSAWRKAKK